tara:strand:+ start:4092 stop:7247 length:3156 start_codon:yes stop_codon:yes gene_type:complete
MKFAHLADTHIRNLKYHSEYRAVFAELYKKLRQESVDFIIHCGDIAHTKTQISPEFVEMCSDFLKNLADIAPTYVILGNHDGNLRNSNRQDALTPIANALGHSNLYLLKDSGETPLNKDFTINVLSVFDRENWTLPTDPDKINIALYHGSISGVTTDIGWKMESGENDVNIFDNFDYGFLGDIHKTNQALDKDGKIRYSGSTIQQNHGETPDKGFLVWDILDKEAYTCVHHVLENPKPFLTVRLTPKGRLPNKIDLPPGARVRLVSDNNLPLGTVRKAIDVTKQRFKPEAVTYLSRAAGERKNIEDATNFLKQDDLRSIAVQEGLIKEYLEDYQLSDKALSQVFEINKKYNSLAEQDEDVHRNINWKLRKLEWDNLFNYGEGNSIDFENLNGVVGVLGKNFSGKSSIIDSLLYTIYNTTSKNNRKNLNLINQNTDECRGYVEIDVGAKTYKIERKSEKYTKKLKGKQTLEAKTDVEFNVLDNATGIEQSLNGVTRIETDKNIRKVFGTVEDFLMTSMASQLDSLAFLNEGSTRRKEILGKFLDLEFFDRKYKMIKEETADLKGALRHLMDRDYDLEIEESRTDLARVEAELSTKERALERQAEARALALEKVGDIQQQIDSIPQEVINIKNVKKQLKECEDVIASLAQQRVEKQEDLKNETEFLKKIENFINNFDIESYEYKKSLLEEHKEKIAQIEKDIIKFEDIKKRNDKKIDLLRKAPCSISLQSKCLFVKDARRAVDDHSRVAINLNQLSLCKTTLSGKISKLNPEQVNEYIEKYQKILEKLANYKNRAIELELEIEKNKTKSLQLTGAYAELKDKEKLYEENRDSIENFENLLLQKSELELDLEAAEREMVKMKEQILEIYKTNGSLEQKFNEILKQKEEFIDLESQYTASDLFMRCMYTNGISYDIIKKRLPVINNEISKILANIVEFEVFFESDDKKLDILIKHPKHSPRPIELGSGAEKTIAAMAIRLSLLNVSTLPKGDIFILDEPGTALDAENMEGFIRILDMIKAQFKTVLLISHLDSLKDIVDQELLIEKHKGLAYINE